MATEINVWTGAEWESIRGPAGATGPEGPTVVSADTVNVAKLGTDGKILVAQADLDARYVNLTGDTMTGQLIVKPAAGPASPDGAVQVIGDNTSATITVQRNADSAGNPTLRFKRTRGTAAAPTQCIAGDTLGLVAWHTVKPDGTYVNVAAFTVTLAAPPANGDTWAQGTIALVVGSTGAAATTVLALSKDGIISPVYHVVTAGIGYTMTLTSPNATSQATGMVVNIQPVASATSCGFRLSNKGAGTGTNVGFQVADLPAGPNNFAVYVDAAASSYLRGNVGINWTTPTNALEVGGTTKLRSTLEVVGNITSAGAAHSFAAASIPSSAVIGSTSFTPATSAAAGAVGSMRWDENFLYVRTATAWKRIALASF